jgi:hypothetical protein
MSAPRVTAHGLGTSRNGMPESKPYVYGGTKRDQPRDGREAARVAAIQAARARKREAAALAAEGRCPDCTYPLDSYGHSVACEDGS